MNNSIEGISKKFKEFGLTSWAVDNKTAIYIIAIIVSLWGLIKFSDPSLQKALASQLAGGSEVANVRIKVRSKFSDLLITGLTLGLVVPRAVTIEGVVVQK